MHEQTLPEWGDDLLSKYFFRAEFNTHATALNFSDAYKLLSRLDSIFRSLQEASTTDLKSELLVPLFLLARSYAAFLGGVRLSMSGQAAESSPVLRSAIESAWYALHIANDPQTPKRINLWFHRNDSDSDKRLAKKEFTVANVRSTHQKLDTSFAAGLSQLYELLIDFGAHPNPFGVMNSMKIEHDSNDLIYHIGVLHPEQSALMFGLKIGIDVGIGVLTIFGLIFPEQYQKLGVFDDLLKINASAHRLFSSAAKS